MKVYNVIIFILLVEGLQSQSIQNIQNPDPYFESLKIYINSLVEMNMYKYGDTVYISQKDYISDFTGSHDGLVLEMVNKDRLFVLTEQKRAIRVLVIDPMEFKNGQSTINVVNFGISRKRKHYTLINNGYSKVRVDYNCDQRKYLYEIVGSH